VSITTSDAGDPLYGPSDLVVLVESLIGI